MGVDYGATHMGLHINFNYQESESAPMQTIGKRIKAKRQELGLNQTELGAAVGLDQSTISDIEKSAGFSATILMRIGKALHLTPEYIMHGSPAEDAGASEIESIFMALDPVQREMLLKMARGLVADDSNGSKGKKRAA